MMELILDITKRGPLNRLPPWELLEIHDWLLLIPVFRYYPVLLLLKILQMEIVYINAHKYYEIYGIH